MDHAVLVDIDVNAGKQVVDALDAAGVATDVAIWATLTDYYSPRLVLAAEWLDELNPLSQYGRIMEVLPSNVPAFTRPNLLILKTSDPFIVELRERLGKLDGIEGLRLDSESFGGRYLEDGYVYRVR